VSGQVVTVRPGTRLVFDGDLVEVAQLDGMSLTIRNDRTGRFEVLSLPRLVAGARSAVGYVNGTPARRWPSSSAATFRGGSQLRTG
jgi:hypothetical protein